MSNISPNLTRNDRKFNTNAQKLIYFICNNKKGRKHDKDNLANYYFFLNSRNEQCAFKSFIIFSCYLFSLLAYFTLKLYI